MLDRALRSRALNLTFCSITSFVAIFTAHYSLAAKLLRGCLSVLVSLFLVHHFGRVHSSQCWSSNNHGLATTLMHQRWLLSELQRRFNRWGWSMLKDWDRLETLRSMRKYLHGFQGGRGWTEVDGMLCLVSKRGSRGPRARSMAAIIDSQTSVLILPVTLGARRQETHQILVTETAIKYTITHNIF